MINSVENKTATPSEIGATFRTSTTPLDEELIIFQDSTSDTGYIEVPDRDPNIGIGSDSVEMNSGDPEQQERERLIALEFQKIDEWMVIRIRPQIAAQLYLSNDFSVNLDTITKDIVIPEYVAFTHYDNQNVEPYINEAVRKHYYELLVSPSPEAIENKTDSYVLSAKEGAILEVVDHLHEQLETFDTSTDGYEYTAGVYARKIEALKAELSSLYQVQQFNEEEREIDDMFEEVGNASLYPDNLSQLPRAWRTVNTAAATAIRSTFAKKAA